MEKKLKPTLSDQTTEKVGKKSKTKVDKKLNQKLKKVGGGLDHVCKALENLGAESNVRTRQLNGIIRFLENDSQRKAQL